MQTAHPVWFWWQHWYGFLSLYAGAAWADCGDEIAESTVLCALKILLPTKKINICGLRCGPSNQAGPKEAAQCWSFGRIMTNNDKHVWRQDFRCHPTYSDSFECYIRSQSFPNENRGMIAEKDRKTSINRDVSEHTFDGYHISCGGEHPSIISWYVLPRELCTSRKEALSKAAFWPPLRLLFNAAKPWTVNGGWLLKGLNPNISGEIGEMLFLSMSVFWVEKLNTLSSKINMGWFHFKETVRTSRYGESPADLPLI